jgi:hypothetical protein
MQMVIMYKITWLVWLWLTIADHHFDVHVVEYVNRIIPETAM